MCVTASNLHAKSDSSEIRTFDVSQVADLVEQSQAVLLSSSSTAKAAFSTGSSILTANDPPAGALAQLHVTSGGEVLATASYAEGHTGTIVLKGSIGSIPYELHLKVELVDKTVTLTVELKDPIALPPYTWVFKLGGTKEDGAGNLIGANSVTLDTTATNLALADGVPEKIWACLVKCVGAVAPGIIKECLDALKGKDGVEEFIKCLTAKFTTAAPQIVVCLVTCYFGKDDS